jgi:hypothetical protein
MLPSHKRALRDIAACRTAAMGGHPAHEAVCDHCGHREYFYHSCKNRSCPKCMGAESSRWLEKRRRELLPVKYFHLVFTLPKELRPYVRANQQALLGALLGAAADSLRQLAADPKFAGGRIGILAVLHTWTRELHYHPHAHLLVPNGALSFAGGKWIHPRQGFLVPVKALSSIFRAKFMAAARKALPQVKFPPSVWRQRWVVYCQDSVCGPEKVLDYLGRYIYRTAIVNARILSVDNGQVTFRHQDSRTRRWRATTLPALEFIRRFLQHVLPKGFHKVRHYGLLHHHHRSWLWRVILLLHVIFRILAPLPAPDRQRAPKAAKMFRACPVCQIGHLLPAAAYLQNKEGGRPALQPGEASTRAAVFTNCQSPFARPPP